MIKLNLLLNNKYNIFYFEYEMSYNHIIINQNTENSFNYNLIPNTIITGDLNSIDIPTLDGNYYLSVKQNTTKFNLLTKPHYSINYTFTNNILTNNNSFVFNNIQNGLYMISINAYIVKNTNTLSTPANIKYIIDNQIIGIFDFINNITIYCNEIINIINNTLQITCEFTESCCDYNYIYFKIILYNLD